VAADMGMSLLVTLNGLRLLRGGRGVDALVTLAAGDAEPGSRCESDTVLATVTRELESPVATGPTGPGRQDDSARPGSQETACIVA